MNEAPLLEIRNLRINYGHIQAVKGIDLFLGRGAIAALVGANGAGKTTTLLGISKILKPAAGTIHFAGRDITRAKSHETVRLGIVQVPEGREILKTLTVRENIELGAYTRSSSAEIRKDMDRVMELFPVLKERGKGQAGNLSGGEQQMLAIARGLMAKPKLLLMDEPSMGLAPILVREIFNVLLEINRAGISILLVEQNVKQALRISQYGFVIETGTIVLSGPGEELMQNPRVMEAYLGA
jgi:branched-chain amino acid transport system ATP-binding protein